MKPSLKTKKPTLGTIADFLGVDNDPSLFQSELKKVNVGSYKDKIINYSDVKNVIEDSKYAHFLAN